MIEYSYFISYLIALTIFGFLLYRVGSHYVDEEEAARTDIKPTSVLWEPVFQFFGDEVKTFLWFNTENPNLGGCKPIDMILKGREEKLAKFINGFIEDNFP